MYNNIKSEKNTIVADLDYNEDGKPIPIVENIMSLRVATELSINLLSETYPEDVDLLFFLGCLPGGVTKEKLEEMWVNETAKSLSRLTSFSFFDVSTSKEKLLLTPTMIKYVDDSMEQSSKKNYLLRICNFYKELLLKSYLEIGIVQAEESAQADESEFSANKFSTTSPTNN